MYSKEFFYYEEELIKVKAREGEQVGVRKK
jgi:hypothetical protein